jgi:hypothetical protein
MVYSYEERRNDMPVLRKVQPAITEKIKAIHEKIQNKQELTRGEKATEATKVEAAYLLSLVAGWEISPEYLKQLTRRKEAPLPAHRAIGTSYTYLVGDLLNVRFTSPHKKKE